MTSKILVILAIALSKSVLMFLINVNLFITNVKAIAMKPLPGFLRQSL
ncbi:hypothetical protein [Nostoc sp.]